MSLTREILRGELTTLVFQGNWCKKLPGVPNSAPFGAQRPESAYVYQGDSVLVLCCITRERNSVLRTMMYVLQQLDVWGLGNANFLGMGGYALRWVDSGSQHWRTTFTWNGRMLNYPCVYVH